MSVKIFTNYYGTKHIQACPLISAEGEDGYAVRYDDGYESWSPKAVFEKAYQPIYALNFGHALAALKDGYKLARAGWNGKGMWVMYIPGSLGMLPVVFGDIYHEFDRVAPYLILKDVNNAVQTWVPSISDLLAEDWQIIE